MSKPDRSADEKRLAILVETIRNAEFLIDAELAKQFLRHEHPECEGALVSALEQARKPIWEAFLQKNKDAADAYWQKLESWETQLTEVMDALGDAMKEYGASLSKKWETIFEEIEKSEGFTFSSEEARTAHQQNILKTAEEKHDEFVRQLDERREALQARLREVMLIPEQAEKELEVTMSSLSEPYVRECEEKSKAIYEEFLA